MLVLILLWRKSWRDIKSRLRCDNTEASKRLLPRRGLRVRLARAGEWVRGLCVSNATPRIDDMTIKSTHEVLMTHVRIILVHTQQKAMCRGPYHSSPTEEQDIDSSRLDSVQTTEATNKEAKQSAKYIRTRTRTCTRASPPPLPTHIIHAYTTCMPARRSW